MMPAITSVPANSKSENRSDSLQPPAARLLKLINTTDNIINHIFSASAFSMPVEGSYLREGNYSVVITDTASSSVHDNATTEAYYDLTTLPEAPSFTNASLTKTIVFSVMFVISFIGNVATLVQMRRLRRRKSTINTLIIHLALADLLVTFFCIAGDAAWAATVQWLAGDFMCKIVKYMQVFPLYLSTYITVAISLDRCVAILDPMRRNGAAQRVRIMIYSAWIFSAIFSIPQLLLFNVLRGPFKEEFYQCVNFGPDTSAWQLRLYTIASLMFMFVLPLAVIGTAYGLIFLTISRKSKEHSVMDSFQMPTRKTWVTRWIYYKHYFSMALCNQPESRRGSTSSSCSTDPSRGPVRSHLLRKAKRKSMRMSFVIVLAFIVCWAPYYIVFIYITFLETVIDPIVFLCFSFIGLSNSMLNPMIYGAFQLCKVQFYASSSWKRNGWRGTSPKLQSTNQDQNRRSDFQPVTPASSSLSRVSRSRSVLSNCQCAICHFEVKGQKVYFPLLEYERSRLDSGRYRKFIHKHLINGNDCLCFHSY